MVFMASIQFIRSLVRYGNLSPANLLNLQTWQSAVIEEIAQNKGGQIVSGSTNGSSFTQSASMTNAQWSGILDLVLTHIENETMPVSRTLAKF